MSRIIVVVPCYNEAARLDAGRFRRLAAAHDDLQFLFVNDGSADATLRLVEDLRRSDPARFAVCDLATNQGKAEAVRRGFLEAFQSKPRYVAFWDADLATPLEAIQSFAAVLDARPQIEIVLGTRIPLLGRAIRRAPRRRWLGRVFSAVASRMLGLAIYDTQCGAKMFRVSDQIQTLFEHPFSTRWIFDVEILARLIRLRRTSGDRPAGEAIYEMPLELWEEKGGSKLKGRDFAKAVFELAVIWRKNLVALPRPTPPRTSGAADVVPLAPAGQATETVSSRDAA